jgi:natural product precursor
MKLESLQLEKFSNNSLQKEQMFSLKGGLVAVGTKTPAGHACGDTNGHCSNFDYGYDVNRGGFTTFHDRTNVTYCP